MNDWMKNIRMGINGFERRKALLKLSYNKLNENSSGIDFTYVAIILQSSKKKSHASFIKFHEKYTETDLVSWKYINWAEESNI